jgi:hypothetical protein
MKGNVMLFEVAVLQKPTREQAKEGVCEKLIFGPHAVVAADDRNAAIAIVIDHAAEFANVAKDRMEVLVRPFAD